MITKLILAGGLTLLASLAPDIVLKEGLGILPLWWPWGKVACLTGAGLLLLCSHRERALAPYGFILALIVALQAAGAYAAASAVWNSRFPVNSFSGQFGGAILLKFLGTIPVIALLWVLYRSPRASYLAKGDLSAAASRISWLGIEEGAIRWGKLSVISALLIAAGTLLLTLLTVTGFSLPAGLSRLPPLVPLILVLALVNSFSEGVVYRSAVLGPLANVLPKGPLILIAAAFFGSAHYYGAPGGPVGVVMSGVLGWYMCRSMYETRGFLAAWIIHFFQDVVIFSTVAILGEF
jgi:membrane protease YdiL (CAAX protease family)